MSGLWLYAWRGLSSDGAFCSGHMLGAGKVAIRRQLIGQQVQPFRVRIAGYLGAGYWRKQHLAAMTSQLASLLGAGLPLRESLHLLAQDHPRTGWRCLLRLLGAKIEQGQTLSQALADFPQVFPPLYCAMTALGELTGRLDCCCRSLAEHEIGRERLKKRVAAALRYPAVICLTATAVVGLMLIWVLPEFARLYAGLGAPLPASTRGLLMLAEHAGGYGLAGGVAAAMLYGAYRRACHYHPRWRRHIQMGLLYLPGLGALIRHHNIYLLFQTLAMTHPAGVPLDSGLAAAAHTVGHAGYRQAVWQLHQHIQQGYALHQAFYRHRLFPPHCHQLIKTGEFAGTLDEVFHQLARLHEQRTHQLTDALGQLVEPLLLLIVGGAVCGLVLVLYLPLLQLGEVMGRI
ncbi:protein transport protein HofC [Sodalis sp. RH21]|uniref:protein transport protein HofC n=1 Tax=unclassified Sodalis (in: enterobacteria) TaxID=2636512 RepID=UPI0039B3924F